MNRSVRYTLQSLCGALLSLCIVCAFTSGRNARKELKCRKLEVHILDSLDNGFVLGKDVRATLDRRYGRYIGIPVDSLNLVKIENAADSMTAVLKSQAYVTKDGTLHVELTQRRPVVRFQKGGSGFYADEEGYIFPLQSSYASHVHIIDGAIPLDAGSGFRGTLRSEREKEWFGKIMKLVKFMENDSRWKGKIVQIHVAGNGELTLIPREGRERFLIGHPTGIEDKFDRMEKYYTAVIPEAGKDRYRTIDLRYKGQIVCR